MANQSRIRSLLSLVAIGCALMLGGCVVYPAYGYGYGTPYYGSAYGGFDGGWHHRGWHDGGWYGEGWHGGGRHDGWRR